MWSEEIIVSCDVICVSNEKMVWCAFPRSFNKRNSYYLLFRRSEYKKYFYPDGAPKSGRTAFAFFCQEVLGSEGQIKTMREASDVWKNVSKV